MEIALIACSAKKMKTETLVPARALYKSDLVKAQLAYTRRVLRVPDRRIFILSAKYGLVPSDIELPYYEKALNDIGSRDRRRWGLEVAFGLGYVLSRLGRDTAVYVMGGKLYSDPIQEACGRLIDVRIQHPSGLGYAQQVAWYKDQVRFANQDAA